VIPLKSLSKLIIFIAISGLIPFKMGVTSINPKMGVIVNKEALTKLFI
jgi:hypothetical protein